MKHRIEKSLMLSALVALSFGPRQTPAQTTTPQTSAQSTQQQPAQQSSEEKWERYTYAGEELSVELPEMPLISESLRRVGPLETEPVRTFGLYSGGVIYMITSYDDPRGQESLDYFATFQWRDPRLTAAHDIKLGGFEGREYESEGDVRQRVRVFRAKHHAYRVRAMSYGTEDPRIARFLDSLSLDGKPSGTRIFNPPPPEIVVPASPPLPVGPGRAGGGAASGDADASNSVETYRTNEVTRKAVIIFKPEPGYSEKARRNRISGTVVLRVVLGSDGKVKNISVVKGLTDGLTERAAVAAQRMLFFPAQKDGRTVSQYVTLEYNFNIY